MGDARSVPLAVLGLGTVLPPTVDVREVARTGGARPADVDRYTGWARACHAAPDEHPSTLGARALAAALANAAVPADELRLVVSTGASRDYVASWSMANEIMHANAASNRCLGLDLSAGCVGTLAAIDLVQGWLGAHGGGCAAVVAAERWSQTIDYTDPGTVNLWAYGDSAGALVLGSGPGDGVRPARLEYLGAEFASAAELNGHVLIPYGGTREPLAPEGANPFARRVSDRPKDLITSTYRANYRRAYDALCERFPLAPTRMVSNQTSPAIIGMTSTAVGMEARTIVTGHDTGHLGGTDMVVGIDRFLRDDAREYTDDRVLLVGASASYGFGMAFFTRPGD
jgi:3-oxoacyl-[acyl-carrier-protein] synthase-3